MANIIAPFGFSQLGNASGPPNFAEVHSTPYLISASNTTAIFKGDAVRYVAGGSPTGFITQWTQGDGSATQQLVGIFLGCEYFSTSQKKNVWNNYWPGSDATGNVNAYVVDEPNSQWLVQAATGPITQTSMGFGADIALTPSGSLVTGISGMALLSPSAGSAATLPFKVVGLYNGVPTAQGQDVTTAGNFVIVAFNNQIYKTQTGV
jgi:hypothetical protein